MPFHRFEDFESKFPTPHLSTGKAPVIEGKYMYLARIHKDAGTGSEPHYHPNELLIFPLDGKIDAVVGKDRRIVSPSVSSSARWAMFSRWKPANMRNSCMS